MVVKGFDTNGRHPQWLKTPREWIERRLEQISPELTPAAIGNLVEEKKSLLSEESIVLGCPVNLTYYLEDINKKADSFKMPAPDLVESVRADLADGITVQATDWTTKQGHSKIVLFGEHWRLVVRPQQGRKSGHTLAAIEHIENLNIPTRQTRFRPVSVMIDLIYKEMECDPVDLLMRYDECKHLQEERQEALRICQQKLYNKHIERKDAYKKILQELQKNKMDSAIEARKKMHAIVRRRYSALGVTLDMLKLRCEAESYSVESVLLETKQQDEPHGDPQNPQPKNKFKTVCHLQLPNLISPKILSNGVLVKLVCPTRSYSQRTKIVSVATTDGKTVVEVNLPSDICKAGDKVSIQVVPRFGMWAHQKAVKNLLDEQVQGYWPDLAKLVCSASQLDTVDCGEPPEKFFCEERSGGTALNDRQRTAVTKALASPHSFCVQGPPGTGKTTVICELIQQLIMKCQRVLLVAPSHVAVDEVLRRVGSREGVRAIRISWDENKVDESVRKFMPENIIDPFIKHVRKSDTGKVGRWQQERNSINEALNMLKKFQDIQQQRIKCQEKKHKADTILQNAQNSLASKKPGLEKQLKEIAEKIKTSETDLHDRQKELAAAESSYQKCFVETGWWEKLWGFFGFGELGKSRKQLRSAAKQYRTQQDFCNAYIRKSKETQDHIVKLKTTMLEAEKKVENANIALRDSINEERSVVESCNKHSILGRHDLYKKDIGTLTDELQRRDALLVKYEYLAKRFNELIAEANEQGENLEMLRKSLLATTNLFCCTTTGIAGSKELRYLAFDALIVDEASRVTDSEFLIGAVRAKRWILVGDEHQLPPYVEQDDVHFLHALSALYQFETTGCDLEKSVDNLGSLWEAEDEDELHQFRHDSVYEFARRLLASGHWGVYRDAYQKGIDSLKKDEEAPSRRLLQAMRDNLMQSLFDRVITSCPDELKVRLVEQRRMIEPIATIVSGPVYANDYTTPSPEELARIGVTPLTTPTFTTPITFLDTSLLGIRARDKLVRKSFVNEVEVRLIVEACRTLERELVQAGSPPVTVSILTFYKAQARLIRDSLFPNPDHKTSFACLQFSVIDNIDCIQGQESDVVFLSFCRTAGKYVSPRFGKWLQDLRRLNVACTRAHRALVFVGQKELLGKLCSDETAMNFYRNLNELFENRPDVMRSIRQFGGRVIC